MSTSATKPPDPSRLRSTAEDLLKQGAAPPARVGPVSVDALALLHRLASAPGSAPDALKLLHELQVHQVELDLQHGQLEANESDLARDLARYRAFFEAAPVGCVLVGLDGQVIEANPAFAKLLGLAPAQAAGRALTALVTPETRTELTDLLDSIRNGSRSGSCVLAPLNDASGAGRPRLRASASYTPETAAVLLMLVPPDPGAG